MVLAQSASAFQYVREWDDEFLNLFPHRYDYIWSKRPQPGQKPNWVTESRHPLSDRLLQQGKNLYGVRFGPTTNYLLFDIDIESPYHPRQDLLALQRLVEALEVLGLVTHVACSSSYSGGIHLYFPFEQPQSSYQLAASATAVLESTGFTVAPGQIELFPNVKLYASDGQLSLFNAHRLPLQEPGSYLLNSDWQAVFTSQSKFVNQWKFAQSRNSLDSEALTRILNSQKRWPRRISNRASKFLADLDAEIELGWTGVGQTNHLLGRIAMRSYVFHHILHGGSTLQGQALVEAIVSTACSLPGFSEWCRHQHELEKKAAEWARSVEASDYYPYGYRDQKPKSSSAPSWNQRQQEAARERIRLAIADLLNKSQLPMGITARRTALIPYGISQSTLSKHKDLWHPHYLATNSDNALEDELHPQEGLPSNMYLFKSPPGKNLHPDSPNKLCSISDADAPQRQSASDDFPKGGSGGVSTGDFGSEEQIDAPGLEESGFSSENSSANPGPLLIRRILIQISARNKHLKRSPLEEMAPDEEYFHQLQEKSGDSFPYQIQLGDMQQSLELLKDVKDANSCLPQMDSLVEKIQKEISRLGWVPVQEDLWVAQHFAGKSRSQLGIEELLILLQQLRQLPSRLSDNT